MPHAFPRRFKVLTISSGYRSTLLGTSHLAISGPARVYFMYFLTYFPFVIILWIFSYHIMKLRQIRILINRYLMKSLKLKISSIKILNNFVTGKFWEPSQLFNEDINVPYELIRGSHKQKCVHNHSDIRSQPTQKYEAIKQRVLCTRYLDRDTIVNHKFHHRYVHCVQQFNHCILK